MAHIVLERFPSTQHRHALEWSRFAQDLVEVAISAAELGAASTVCFAWRLVSENHRELARGPQLFASESAARASASDVARNASRLTLAVVPEARYRSIAWYGRLDGVVALTCARRYENRATARNASLLAAQRLLVIGEEIDAGSTLAIRPHEVAW